MNNLTFSKIWILIVLIALVTGGFLTWQYFGVPKEEVKNETTDWKTYRNREYGYEIKYPEDWNVEKDLIGKLVNFYNPSTCEVGGKIPCSVGIAIRDNTGLLSPDKWADKYIGKDFIYSPKEPIIVSDLEGIKFTQGGLLHIYQGPTVILVKDNLVYEFVTGEMSNLPIIFNQMLSTFKLIEKETSVPSITVTILSPNGGEVLELGKTYQINWSCSDVPPVTSFIARIYLLLDEQIPHGTIDGTPEAYSKITGCPVEGGKFLWKVGEVERGTISLDNKYRVKVNILAVIDDNEQLAASDISDNYFSIVK